MVKELHRVTGPLRRESPNTVAALAQYQPRLMRVTASFGERLCGCGCSLSTTARTRSTGSAPSGRLWAAAGRQPLAAAPPRCTPPGAQARLATFTQGGSFLEGFTVPILTTSASAQRLFDLVRARCPPNTFVRLCIRATPGRHSGSLLAVAPRPLPPCHGLPGRGACPHALRAGLVAIAPGTRARHHSRAVRRARRDACAARAAGHDAGVEL